MKKRNILFTVIILIIGIIVGVALTARLRVQEAVLAEKAGISGESREFLGRLNKALSEVAESVKPSVVNISTTKTVTLKSPFGDLLRDPLFRRFFGEEFEYYHRQRELRSTSLGSGVIVSGDGYILTNEHVVRDAEDIDVTLADGRTFKGRVVGTDAKSDLAVVKIDAGGLPAAKFGDSDDLRVGDLVIAIGVPFGLSQTTTMGIVSAVGRSNVGIAEYEDFIQTDAAINPGNSGGAMVNIDGELVGINTAIFSLSGGYMGIGFAIPSNMARPALESIIKHGKVIRGWLGVTIQDLDPELARHFKVKAEKGALVTEVLEGSPAEKGGLKRGDLIVKFDGKDVTGSSALKNMAAGSPPGKSVPVVALREGKEITLNVTLGEYPEKPAARMPRPESALRGIDVRELTPEARKALGIPRQVSGVVVAGVEPGSPAAEVLRENDVIQEINRQGVESLEDFRRAASGIGPAESVLLLVYREGRSFYAILEP